MLPEGNWTGLQCLFFVWRFLGSGCRRRFPFEDNTSSCSSPCRGGGGSNLSFETRLKQGILELYFCLMSHSDRAQCVVDDWIGNMFIAKADEVPMQRY
jgi:hypothetical protein